MYTQNVPSVVAIKSFNNFRRIFGGFATDLVCTAVIFLCITVADINSSAALYLRFDGDLLKNGGSVDNKTMSELMKT
jgi:hypothetical protein